MASLEAKNRPICYTKNKLKNQFINLKKGQRISGQDKKYLKKYKIKNGKKILKICVALFVAHNVHDSIA